MLEPVGVADFEEAVLRALLATGRRTPGDLAAELDLPAGAVSKALLRLADLGLAVSEGQAFAATDPRAALTGALRERRTELDQASRAVEALSAAFHDRIRRRVAGSGGVEPVEGPARLRDALARAEREVATFGAPPFGPGIPGDPAPEISLLARRVSYRAVHTLAALEESGYAERIRAVARLGGQARVAPALPLTMVVVDGREALVLSDAGPRTAVAVRHPELCDALVALFEAVWERAAPLFTGVGEGSAELDPEDHAILQLLNAGMTDDVIGRQLGISERTVRRRVAELAARLGAGSRFQIGAQAVRRGWLA